MSVTSWLMKWWAAQTPLTRPHHQPGNVFSLLRTMTTTSNLAVTALAYCVNNLAHMHFTKDYSCLDYRTENTPSWAFFYSDIWIHPWSWTWKTARSVAITIVKENIISLIPASSHLLPPGYGASERRETTSFVCPPLPIDLQTKPRVWQFFSSQQSLLQKSWTLLIYRKSSSGDIH